MKKKFVIIACALLLCCVTGLTLYEPASCPLCHTEPSDAPYLVDLHTGEIGEIRIGKGELSDDPATFVFYFVEIAGCKGYCDTAARCCQITLESERKSMNPFLFCRSCREKLQMCRQERYVILDKQLGAANVYPVASGEFNIRGYTFKAFSDDISFVQLYIQLLDKNSSNDSN